ncbi:MAG: hypothetical protein CM15mP120_06450 [Pseudomonadota bacterium]|nr:MAG: hypothetical protein CM15mP120_06450 [Pseudomonadota bacterium]
MNWRSNINTQVLPSTCLSGFKFMAASPQITRIESVVMPKSNAEHLATPARAKTPDAIQVCKQLEQRLCHDAVAGSHTQLTVSTAGPLIPPFESAWQGRNHHYACYVRQSATGRSRLVMEAHFLQTPWHANCGLGPWQHRTKPINPNECFRTGAYISQPSKHCSRSLPSRH